MVEISERVSRAEQKRRTRAALIYAARGLFVAQGYTATTADAIARAARVSRATFYLHFRSKAEIVLELMHDLEPELLADFGKLKSLEATTEAAQEWLRGHAAMWRRHTMEFTAMEQALADEASVADEWFDFYGRIADSVPELIVRLRDGGASDERARVRLTAVAMTIDRAFYFAVVRDKPEFFELIVPEIAAAIAQLLQAAPER